MVTSHYTTIRRRSRIPYEPDTGFYVTNDAGMIILQDSEEIADIAKSQEKLPLASFQESEVYHLKICTRAKHCRMVPECWEPLTSLGTEPVIWVSP